VAANPYNHPPDIIYLSISIGFVLVETLSILCPN